MRAKKGMVFPVMARDHHLDLDRHRGPVHLHVDMAGIDIIDRKEDTIAIDIQRKGVGILRIAVAMVDVSVTHHQTVLQKGQKIQEKKNTLAIASKNPA